ncbi:SDR family oxidoreductase [Lentzea sp. HUAS12]|uniref:SDR family oxidoreductase n=1 Tax=Lentzea sp. HUAS12 TaxID=2951806 RepID=UPI00209D22D3|nr:NAD(P)H-binding protein [Lentzea sp. HUAS12]USX48725.1 NAD(P)H-binding protein [Lentzea sp. HUAS12]
MKIAVAGGTGTVGRHVVSAARSRGHDVVVLARAEGVDVITGAGLRTALAGVDAVIDTTNLTTMSARRSRKFFETATRTLLKAGEEAGVGHHIALSIVGIDDLDASYYAGKLAQERAVAAGRVPYSIARTGQFHEFAEQLLSTMRGPVVLVPRTLLRSVSAREAGGHLVDVAEAGPVGRAVDFVGPEDERLADLVRRMLAHDGSRRRAVELGLPGLYGRGLASGALRGTPPRLEGETTFDDWLNSEDHRPVE